MTQFSWKKSRKRMALRLKKRIKQLEKVGNGQNCMECKSQLLKLERIIEETDK